jgi:hypothetical protein
MVKFSGFDDINFIRTVDKLLPMLRAAESRILQNWAIYDRTSALIISPEIDKFVLPLRLPFPRNPNFFGRSQELLELERVILPNGDSGLSVVVLCGMGGIGKTQLALEFVYRNHKHFTSIFWVDARSKTSAARDFVALARRLQPGWNQQRVYNEPPFMENDLRPEVFQEAQAIVKDWLALSGNNKWLLIFDNLDDLETFDLRKEFFPFASCGRIMITSRRLESRRYSTFSLNIDEMDLKSACGLLQASSGNYPTLDSEARGL